MRGLGRGAVTASQHVSKKPSEARWADAMIGSMSGSAKHLDKISEAINKSDSGRGIVFKGHTYKGSLNDQPLATTDDGRTALTHVVIAGESAFSVVSDGRKVSVALLPFGYLRSQTGRNNAPQLIVAAVDLTTGHSGRYRVGSSVQSLGEDVYLSPAHFDVALGTDRSVTVSDAGSEHGSFVLDASMLADKSELGRVGFHSGTELVRSLQSDPQIWNPALVPQSGDVKI